MFESGEMPEAVTRTFIEAGKYEKPSNKWSWGNKLLMLAAETHDARGYDQWQKVGRNVRKGTKAFYIFGPSTRKLGRENEKTGEKEELLIIAGFHVIPVFRYEDTEGEELPEVNYEPKQLPPLYEVAERFGLSVLYSPMLDRAWGYYSSAQNKIVLHTEQEKTFFHELGHAAHAKFATLKAGQDAEQEIIAEFVACVLCNSYGIEGFESHAYRYISGYVETEDPQMVVQKIMKVLAEVEKCLKLILENANVESLKRIIAQTGGECSSFFTPIIRG